MAALTVAAGHAKLQSHLSDPAARTRKGTVSNLSARSVSDFRLTVETARVAFT